MCRDKKQMCSLCLMAGGGRGGGRPHVEETGGPVLSRMTWKSLYNLTMEKWTTFTSGGGKRNRRNVVDTQREAVVR